MHQDSYSAANDQYLQSMRDASTAATYGWLVDQKKPDTFHVSVMRAAYATIQLGDDVLLEILSDDLRDGFESVFRGSYEFSAWLDDFEHDGREDDELLQLAVGFIVGAAKAWSVVKGVIRG